MKPHTDSQSCRIIISWLALVKKRWLLPFFQDIQWTLPGETGFPPALPVRLLPPAAPAMASLLEHLSASPQSPSPCPPTVVSSLPVSSSGGALPALPLTSTVAFVSSPQVTLASKFPTLLDGQDVIAESLQLAMENVVVAHNSISMQNVGIPLVSEKDSNEHGRRLSVLPVASQETEALSPLVTRLN
ncbi:hypothetical protein Nepgr_012554 [Nepenthes gracilis]|uniref:Uncharacterized protein n=1 Tax=Nepenthes gracilis TaxID=150966 RepID=A0AAD3SG68_NEPGR|nr:hypothetical protein Nepgr_012554 [Nepenthes gracilis]